VSEYILDPVTGLPYRIGGGGAVATAQFTIPANTTYASGQLIANNATAGSVVPLTFATAARTAGGTGFITRARASIGHAGLAGTEQVRLRLFRNSPIVANGNGGAFSANIVGAIALGRFDMTLDDIGTDGSKGFGIPVIGSAMIFDCAAGSQSLYGLLEARSGFTLSLSDVVTVALEISQD
jgi:hypothetical protein